MEFEAINVAGIVSFLHISLKCNQRDLYITPGNLLFWVVCMIVKQFQHCILHYIYTIYPISMQIPHISSYTLLQWNHFGFLHFCGIFSFFQCNKPSQFMQLQFLRWMPVHPYCISLNTAAIPEVLQIADDYVFLVKSNQQLSQYFPQAAHWLPLKTKVLISKCRSSIHKASENVSVLLPMSVALRQFRRISALIVLNCSVLVVCQWNCRHKTNKVLWFCT